MIEFDATHLVCPLPLLHTKQKMHAMAVGEVIRVTTSDKSSVIDFTVYAEVNGHELIASEHKDDNYIFTLKKLKNI